MPVAYCFDNERELLLYGGFGHCTGQELVHAEETARGDPRRRTGMRILLDLRAVDELDVALDDLKHGVELNARLAADNWILEKTAVLIRNPHDDIVAELYEELARPVVDLHMGTFTALRPALDWLGLAGQSSVVERLIRDLRSHHFHGNA